MSDERSKVLPNDPFDIKLAELIGLTNGAHTPQQTIQEMDEYGNTLTHIIQTVKTDKGEHVFLQQASAKEGFRRFYLPPRVLGVIDRQRENTVTQVRRRHGRRLAEERAVNGERPVFTPEMRRKALETRRRNAARKKR